MQWINISDQRPRTRWGVDQLDNRASLVAVRDLPVKEGIAINLQRGSDTESQVGEDLVVKLTLADEDSWTNAGNALTRLPEHTMVVPLMLRPC